MQVTLGQLGRWHMAISAGWVGHCRALKMEWEGQRDEAVGSLLGRGQLWMLFLEPWEATARSQPRMVPLGLFLKRAVLCAGGQMWLRAVSVEALGVHVLRSRSPRPGLGKTLL